MALITLTPGQFAKTPVGRKPGASYKNYLDYVNRRRQQKQTVVPTGMAQANAILLKNLTSGVMNPAQMRREATRAVQDSISTALGDLRSTTAAAQEQANRQAAAYEGFAKVLGDMRRSDADYISGLYRDAASDQARFASGITGAVGDAARADAAAQVRDVAAATGQGPAGYHGPDPGAMQSVGYFLGGQIPSARLAENAAYLGENELRQGYASAARLGLESAGMRQKTLDLQAELAGERAKLAKQRPGLIREQLKDMSSDQRSNLATLANVLYLQNTQAKTTADLTGTYQGVPTTRTYIDSQGKVRQYDPDRYQVATRKNGTQYLKPLPVPKSSSSVPRNKAGLTPSQVATAKGRAASARNRREGDVQGLRSDMLRVLQNTKGPLYTQPDEFHRGLPGYGAKQKDYATAKQYLMTNFANDLIRQYPGERARILAMVEEVLGSAGFKRTAAAKKTPPLPAAPLFGSPFFPSSPLVPKGR